MLDSNVSCITTITVLGKSVISLFFYLYNGTLPTSTAFISHSSEEEEILYSWCEQHAACRLNTVSGIDFCSLSPIWQKLHNAQWSLFINTMARWDSKSLKSPGGQSNPFMVLLSTGPCLSTVPCSQLPHHEFRICVPSNLIFPSPWFQEVKSQWHLLLSSSSVSIYIVLLNFRKNFHPLSQSSL